MNYLQLLYLVQNARIIPADGSCQCTRCQISRELNRAERDGLLRRLKLDTVAAVKALRKGETEKAMTLLGGK